MEDKHTGPAADESEALVRAWKAAAGRLPPGWTLDGIRCTSTGLAPGERGDRWRAAAVGPGGASAEATANDPAGALGELLRSMGGGQVASGGRTFTGLARERD